MTLSATQDELPQCRAALERSSEVKIGIDGDLGRNGHSGLPRPGYSGLLGTALRNSMTSISCCLLLCFHYTESARAHLCVPPGRPH